MTYVILYVNLASIVETPKKHIKKTPEKKNIWLKPQAESSELSSDHDPTNKIQKRYK